MPRRAAEVVVSDSSSKGGHFKWTVDCKLAMAEYLVAHYDEYKNVGEKGNKKQHFLRKMREELQLTCNDVQLKNGFTSFLGKYTEVRAKLNSSGFGIDPAVDATIDFGWIKRECPYFEMLDSVFGTRPNITPPYIVETTDFGEIGVNDSEVPEVPDKIPSLVIVSEEPTLPTDTDTGKELDKGTDTTPTTSKSITTLIRSSFAGIGVKPKGQPVESKSGVSALTRLMRETSENQCQVENKKLKLEEQKFEHQKSVEEKRIELDREKLTYERDMQAAVLQDKREERAFEIRKLE